MGSPLQGSPFVFVLCLIDMKYKGGCHCGKTLYEVETNLESIIRCNCSHCQIKGLLLTFVPKSDFTLLTDESSESVYHFNKHIIDHLFCSTCGVQSYAKGKDKEGNETRAINVRCLEGIDFENLKLTTVDGKSW